VHVTLQPPLLAVGSRDASAGVDVAGANATNDSTQMMVPESSGEVGPDSAYSDNEGNALVQQLEPQVERSQQRQRRRQQQQQQQQQQQRKAQPDLDKNSNTASPRLDSTELSSDATAAVGAIGAALAGGTDSLNAFSATLDAEADKLAAAQRRSLRDADGTIDAQMLDETKDLLVSALCDSGISFNSG
jgi:chemotaxis response regulator CheB